MLTLGTAKQRLARYAPAAYLADRINTACELLLTEQNHKGSIDRVAFVVTDGILSLPRQYFGCLGTTIEEWPRPIYNHWYEFIGGGPGESDQAYASVLDLGDRYPTALDVASVDEDGCRLKVVSELSEDSGLQILIRGLDADTEAVWSTVEGERLEGEYVDLATAGTTSSATFTTVSVVLKPITKGKVYLYAVSTTDVLIATYDPAEERPSYRRYRVPECDDEEVNVVALCQRRHVDLRDDNDPLPVENLNALTNAMLALQYKDNNDLERYQQYLNAGKDLLQKEQRRAQPAHTYPPMVNMPGFTQIYHGY